MSPILWFLITAIVVTLAVVIAMEIAFRRDDRREYADDLPTDDELAVWWETTGRQVRNEKADRVSDPNIMDVMFDE